MNFDEKDFSFGLDWLHGTLPFNDVKVLFDSLGKIDSRLQYEYWKPMGSFRNYNTRFICQGKPSLTIAYNRDYLYNPYDTDKFYNDDTNNIPLVAEDHPFNPGIFVSFSGDGLRWLNEFPGTVEKIIKYFRLQRFCCSRIDFCCDFYNKKNKVIPKVISAFKNAVVEKPGKLCLRSNMRRTSGKNGSVRLFQYDDTIRPGDKKVFNVEFGNHSSSFGMFRCYDKWFEISSGRLNLYKEAMLELCEDDYWYRMEYELHNGNHVRYAESMFNNLADGIVNVRTAFGWCLENMFDVVKCEWSSQVVSRREVASEWSSMIQFIHFVQFDNVPIISVPWVEKTPEQFVLHVRRLSKFVHKIHLFFENCPDKALEILSEGKEKYDSDIVQKSIFDSYFSRVRCT